MYNAYPALSVMLMRVVDDCVPGVMKSAGSVQCRMLMSPQTQAFTRPLYHA